MGLPGAYGTNYLHDEYIMRHDSRGRSYCKQHSVILTLDSKRICVGDKKVSDHTCNTDTRFGVYFSI
jgi:hypothetical protein